MPSIREQIEAADQLERGRILTFDKKDDGDTLYGIDIFPEGVRFSGTNSPEGPKTFTAKVLNIENSITTPLPFDIFGAKTVGQLLGPQEGYKTSRDYLKKMIEQYGPDVYVKYDKSARGRRKIGIIYLTDEKNNQLINVNTEMLKAGMAVPYTRYLDIDVNTPEAMEAYQQHALAAKNEQRRGIFSRTAVDPEGWNHGYEISALHAAEVDQAIEKSVIKNRRILSIFSDQVTSRGFTLPSKLGASYFYQRGLYNATQAQTGGEKYDYRSEGLAVKAVILSRLASGKSEILSDTEYKILRNYDIQLQKPGFGAYLNETIFIPSGMGRVYKEELGFFGSVAGLIGKAIDNTAVFYSSGAFTVDQNYSLLEPLDIQYTSIRNVEQPGFFESTLPAITNGFLTTSASLLVYFGFGVPAGMVMSNIFKTSLNQMIQTGLTPANGYIGKTISFFARFSALGPSAAFSGVEGARSDILTLIEESVNNPSFKGFNEVSQSLNISIKYYENKPLSIFSLGTGLQNHVSRKVGALTFQKVASVVVNHIIPYERETLLYNQTQEALDQLVETTGADIEIKADVVINRIEENGAVRYEVDRKTVSNIQFNENTIGIKRAQKLMESYKTIFSLIPLNIAWKVTNGTLPGDNLKFRTLGDVLDFTDIAYLFRPFFDLNTGPLSKNYKERLRSSASWISKINADDGSDLFKSAALRLGRLSNFLFVSNPLMSYVGSGVSHVYSRLTDHLFYYRTAKFRTNSNKINEIEKSLRDSILKELNLTIGPAKSNKIEQVTEKVVQLTEDKVEDYVKHLALAKEQELILQNKLESKLFLDNEGITVRPTVDIEASLAQTSEFLETNQYTKTAKQQAGRITASLIESKNLRLFALTSTALATWFFNPLFNSGSVSLLDQIKVNSLLGKEDSMVHFTAGDRLISTNNTWVGLTTVGTGLFSLAVGAAFAHASNDLMYYDLNAKGSRKLIDLQDNQIKQILDEVISKENSDTIVDYIRNHIDAVKNRANNNNGVLSFDVKTSVKTTKFKTRLFTATLLTWSAIQVFNGAVRGGIALGGNIFNRIFRGRSKNKLNFDTTLASDLALMQKNIASRVSSRGYTTDLDVANTFAIETIMNQLQITEDTSNFGNKNVRVYATQIPLFAIQFLLAAEVQTYYDIRNQSNKEAITLKFGIQSHQAPGANFLLESPITYLPQERGKGLLGWVRQFQWNSNPNNSFTALTDVTTLIGGAITGLLAFSVAAQSVLGVGEAFVNSNFLPRLTGFKNFYDYTVNDSLRRALNVNSAIIQGLAAADDLYVGLFGLATHPSKVLSIDVLSEVLKSLHRSTMPNKPKTAKGSLSYFNQMSKGQKVNFVSGFIFSTAVGYGILSEISRTVVPQNFRENNEIAYGLTLGLGATASSFYLHSKYLESANSKYKKLTTKTSNIFRGLSRNENVIETRILQSSSPKYTKHLSTYLGLGLIAATLITDTDFGLTQGMDRNPIERLISVATLAGGIGLIYGTTSYIYNSPGALFAIYEAALKVENSWINRPVKDLTNFVKNRVIKNLTYFKNDYINYQKDIIRKLVNENGFTQEGLEIFGDVINLISKEGEVNPEARKRLESLGLDVDAAIDPNSQKALDTQIKDKLNPLAADVFPEGNDALRRHTTAQGVLPAKQMEFERLYFGGESISINGLEMTPTEYRKLTIRQFNNKLYRKASGLINQKVIRTFKTATFVTAAVAFGSEIIMKFVGDKRLPQLSSKGSIDNYFINTDGSSTNVSSARAFNNVLKIITNQDRKVVNRYIETNLGQIQIQEGQNIRKVTNSEFNRLTRSIEAIQSMGLLNASNVFISVSPLGVGFSLRNDEEGIRVTPYAQFQVPGFDISTAVYNMSRKYDFKSGYVNLKNQQALQRAVQKYNDMALTRDISDPDLKYQQAVVARAYATLDPNSHVNKRGLTPIYDITQSAQIGSSKILSILMKEKIRTAQNFKYLSIYDLYSSSFDFTNVSTNSLLTEQIIANELVDNPNLSKELNDRRLSIRMSYHLKNTFYKDNVRGSFSVQQALLKGMLEGEASPYGPSIIPKEETNGAAEVINNTIGNVTSLLRFLSADKPILFHSFQAIGLTAFITFMLSSLSMLTKAGSVNLNYNQNFLLSRMFGTNKLDTIEVFKKYKVSIGREPGLLIVNNAPIFRNHPGEMVFKIQPTTTENLVVNLSSSLRDEIPAALNRAVNRVHGINNRFLSNLMNLTNVAASIDDLGTDNLFFHESGGVSWFGIRKRTLVGVNATVFKTELKQNYLDYLGLEEIRGQIVSKGAFSTINLNENGLYQAIENSLQEALDNIPTADKELLRESLGLAKDVEYIDVKNTFIKQLNVLESFQANYNSFLSSLDEFFENTTIKSSIENIRYVDIGYVAQNVDEAKDVAKKLINTLINDYIKDELLQIQRRLGFLSPTDLNDIYKANGYLRTLAKYSGGVLDLIKNPFKRSQPINPQIPEVGRNLHREAANDLLNKNLRQPEARRTLIKTLGDMGDKFTIAFSAITFLTDMIDSYGYTTSLGLAMKEGSYTEAELNYLAYESGIVYGRSITSSLLVGGGLYLGTKGISLGYTLLAAKLGKVASTGITALALVATISAGVYFTNMAEKSDNRFVRSTGNYISSGGRVVNQLFGELGVQKKRFIEFSPLPDNIDTSGIGGLETFTLLVGPALASGNGAGLITAAAATGKAVLTVLGGGAASTGAAPIIIGFVIFAAAAYAIGSLIGYFGFDKTINSGLMSVNRSLSRNFGIVGQFFSTPEGTAMNILDDTSSGPIMFATPRQALEQNAIQFYDLGSDIDLNKTQNYLFGQIGNSRASSTGAIASEAVIPFGSRILNSILISRAKYFRQMIVGASIWRMQIEEGSNALQLKLDLQNEILYKETVTQQARDVDNEIRKDSEELQVNVNKARETNDQLAQSMAVMMLANNKRNTIDPINVDQTKQRKVEAVLSKNETDNRYLTFVKDAVNYLSDIQTVLVEKIEVAKKDNNEYIVTTEISNRNDLISSITNQSIYVNSYA